MSNNDIFWFFVQLILFFAMIGVAIFGDIQVAIFMALVWLGLGQNIGNNLVARAVLRR